MITKKNKIILIAGGSGSGKTFIVNRLIKEIGGSHCCIMSEDNYYNDLSSLPFNEREKINFDSPDSKDFYLLFEHLSELKNGREIRIPVYDFKTHTRKSETILLRPKPIIFAEGILILQSKKILDLADIRIFIDTPDDIRLIRRIKRDIKERGRSTDSVLTQYIDTVRPMYQKYVLPSKQNADLIIDGENYKPENVQKIYNKLRIKN